MEQTQEQMLERLKKLQTQEYTGEAGAGMVKVTVRADMTVTKVEIDNEMFAKTAPEILEDLDFLADLFKAATNQAIERGNEGLVEELSNGMLHRVIG